VTLWAQALWLVTAVFVFLNLCFILLYYRLRHRTGIVYCLSLTEKILATVPARLLGMQVFWAERAIVGRWLSKNPLKIFYKLLSRFATVVAVSGVVARQLETLIRVPKRRIKVIYPGVDLRKFQMKEHRWEHVARYNIGCVARLETAQGIEFLVQAVKIVKEFVPFIRLIIVGEGPERKKLVWLSERLGLKEIVQWVGHQKEIEKWYSFFDALAMPSVAQEAFTTTLVEAMACGIPVIATEIDSTQEIITHQQTGLLAKPSRSQALADQLIYLFNNRAEARQMILAARDRVEELFNLERMVRDYYLLFRK
jgi:glycosyltransferase involved in cell wall biosynthesis